MQTDTERVWSPREIRTAVENALKKRPCNAETVVRTVGTDFVCKFPGLTAMLAREQLDEDRIRSMLTMIDRIGKGYMNENDASVKVGTELAEEYVLPLVQNRSKK